MNPQDFIAWALDPKRSDEEAFFAEVVTERGYSAWCSKHIPGYYSNWQEESEKHRLRRLNPAHRAQLEPSEVEHAAEMLAGVEYLFLGYCQDRPIRDITGLRFFSHLKKLYVEQTELRDFSPVTALVNLEELHFRDDVVEDLRPVGALPKLRQLWATIREPWPLVDGLSRLTELENFWWNGNLLVLDGLGPFPKLREARLNNHCLNLPARDATRLPAMPALRFLVLNGVRRLDGVERWTELVDLEVEGTFSDLTPLTALRHVTHLRLSTDKPLDLGVLCRLPELRALKLTSLQPQEWFGLTEAPHLHEVGASRCEANDREAATLQEVLPPWDEDFLIAEPRLLPALEFVACSDEEWRRRHQGEPQEAGYWGGNRALQAAEWKWFLRRVQVALDKLVGAGWGNVEHMITVEKLEAAERLPEIMTVVRQLLASRRHRHRVWLRIELKAPELPKKKAPPESEEKRLQREIADHKEWERHSQEEAERREREHKLRQLQQEGVKIDPEEFAPGPKPLEVDDLDADNEVYDDEGEPHLLADEYELYSIVSEEVVVVHVRHVEVAERLLQRRAQRL